MLFKSKKTFQLAAITAGCLMSLSSFAQASVLQIFTPETAPDWDETSAVQTGTVGGAGVSVQNTISTWNSTFNDERINYSDSGQFGSLAQPAGTSGDFFNIQVFNGAVFSTTVTLQDALLDPIFYILDIDTVGATAQFEPGGDLFQVNADGSFTGNLLTANSGLLEGTNGAFAAVQYNGLFGAGATFTFDFNFAVTSTIGNENIALGIATPDIAPVPLPAAFPMLVAGLSVFGWVGRRRNKRDRA